MSDVLCVTNRGLCREDFFARIERIAASHPAGMILREKDLTAKEYGQLAKRVLEICAGHGVTCMLHSFVDVALELQAEAIHLPLHILREMKPEEKARFAILGASCHSVEDALEAQALGCTYITAGHVFETDCKKGLPGRGIIFLQEVCSAVQIPVYAIGGISGKNVSQVRAAGAAGVCLMSSLMVCDDVEGLFREMEEGR